MIFLIFLIFISYFIIIGISWIGWHKISIPPHNLDGKYIFVSVIIAARDEDKNLPLLFKDLKDQNYPFSQMEILIIDDHSENKICENEFFRNNTTQNFNVIELADGFFGKKQALRTGASLSKGELLLFTDADCRLKSGWVKSFVNSYVQGNPTMIIGLVDYVHTNGFFANFFRFDFLSLVVVGAGLSSLGYPVMCNGANLAIKRETYLSHINSLRNEIASGDDIFLLHSVKRRNNSTINVLKDSEAVVETKGPVTIEEFISQRTRWASKSWVYNDFSTLLLAITVLVSNFTLIGLTIYSFLNKNFAVLIYVFIIKTTADCLIIAAGLNFFGKRKEMIKTPLFSVIYPVYFFIVFILSLFNDLTWKGRKI